MLSPNEAEELAEIARVVLLRAIQQRLERKDDQAAGDVRAALKDWTPGSGYEDLLQRANELIDKG